MQPMALYQHRLDKASDIPAADELKLKDGEEMKLMDNEGQQETAFQAIRRAVWPYHLTLVLTFTVTLCKFHHLFLLLLELWSRFPWCGQQLQKC